MLLNMFAGDFGDQIDR